MAAAQSPRPAATLRRPPPIEIGLVTKTASLTPSHYGSVPSSPVARTRSECWAAQSVASMPVAAFVRGQTQESTVGEADLLSPRLAACTGGYPVHSQEPVTQLMPPRIIASNLVPRSPSSWAPPEPPMVANQPGDANGCGGGGGSMRLGGSQRSVAAVPYPKYVPAGGATSAKPLPATQNLNVLYTAIVHSALASKSLAPRTSLQVSVSSTTDELSSSIATMSAFEPDLDRDEWAGVVDDPVTSLCQAVMQDTDLVRETAQAELRAAVERAGGCVDSARTGVDLLKEAEECLAGCIGRARDSGAAEHELLAAQRLRRNIHNAILDLKGQLRVCCRVRPLNELEKRKQDAEAVRALSDSVVEVSKGSTFTLDSVFGPESTQEEVFENCRDLVQSAVHGYNATIFSYGNTGAGKTYTMYGTVEEEGIAPRCVTELFDVLDGLRCDRSVTVAASMVELYSDRLIDMLAERRPGDVGEQPKLKLRQDQNGRVQVEGLEEREANDVHQMRALLRRGARQRAVKANAMNSQSSRSHLIFTIKITSTGRQTSEVISGKLLLCDLGGSEKLGRTGVTGTQMKESIELNKSLSALGDVIEAVAGRKQQVPYRNHKLTQLLQDSIGGSAKTLMFVNVSPALSNLDQTTHSLKYAMRAKRVTNAPGLNVADSTTAGEGSSLSSAPGSELREPRSPRDLCFPQSPRSPRASPDPRGSPSPRTQRLRANSPPASSPRSPFSPRSPRACSPRQRRRSLGL